MVREWIINTDKKPAQDIVVMRNNQKSKQSKHKCSARQVDYYIFNR